MSTVQAVVAGGGVALIAVMADRIFGMKVSPRQWWGLGLTAAGLVLLAVTMPAQTGSHASYSLAPMIAFEAGLLGLGALLIVGPHAAGARAEHHGVALAIASGILFGVCNVSVKALSGLVVHHGVLALISPWTAVALCASAAAFYAGPQPAGRRGRHRHRPHGHGHERRLHLRRHPRVRRPAARRPGRHRPAGRRLPARDRRLGAHPGTALGHGRRTHAGPRRRLTRRLRGS